MIRSSGASNHDHNYKVMTSTYGIVKFLQLQGDIKSLRFLLVTQSLLTLPWFVIFVIRGYVKFQFVVSKNKMWFFPILIHRSFGVLSKSLAVEPAMCQRGKRARSGEHVASCPQAFWPLVPATYILELFLLLSFSKACLFSFPFSFINIFTIIYLLLGVNLLFLYSQSFLSSRTPSWSHGTKGACEHRRFKSLSGWVILGSILNQVYEMGRTAPHRVCVWIQRDEMSALWDQDFDFFLCWIHGVYHRTQRNGSLNMSWFNEYCIWKHSTNSKMQHELLYRWFPDKADLYSSPKSFVLVLLPPSFLDSFALNLCWNLDNLPASPNACFPETRKATIIK